MTFADLMPAEIEQEVEEESFRIDSYEKAEWAMEKAGTAQAELDKIEAEAAALIARIQVAKEEREKPFQQTLEQMAYFLDPWTRAECEKADKKSIPLATGVLKIVTGRESLHVDDDESLVEWLKENDDQFLRTKTTVAADKNSLKQAIKDGAEFPGCRIERGPDRLELKPKPLSITA